MNAATYTNLPTETALAMKEFGVGIWSFPGAWDLGFGVSAASAAGGGAAVAPIGFQG